MCRVSRLRSPLDIFAVVLVVVGYLNDRRLHDGQAAAKQVERSAMMIRTGYVGSVTGCTRLLWAFLLLLLLLFK